MLLPLLDGSNDRATLRERIAAALRQGTLEVAELPAGPPPPAEGRIGEVAELYLVQALGFLERNALLEPDA